MVCLYHLSRAGSFVGTAEELSNALRLSRDEGKGWIVGYGRRPGSIPVQEPCTYRSSVYAGSFVGAGRQENSATPSDFVMAEGTGWKLGYDRSPASASSYSALIGSDGFSFAITRQEYDDFIKVCLCSFLPFACDCQTKPCIHVA